MKEAPQDLTTRSDEELMVEYKLGNGEAFKVLYDRHREKVYGYLKGKLSTRSETDDVFQECFLRVHRFRSKYDASFPFIPWLFTICRNGMVDYLRRRMRIQEQPLGGAEFMNQENETSQELAQGLKTLSVREGSVVGLHYLEGYTFDEVATHLKIQPAAARKISSRALQKLKAFWRSET